MSILELERGLLNWFLRKYFHPCDLLVLREVCTKFYNLLSYYHEHYYDSNESMVRHFAFYGVPSDNEFVKRFATATSHFIYLNTLFGCFSNTKGIRVEPGMINYLKRNIDLIKSIASPSVYYDLLKLICTNISKLDDIELVINTFVANPRGNETGPLSMSIMRGFVKNKHLDRKLFKRNVGFLIAMSEVEPFDNSIITTTMWMDQDGRADLCYRAAIRAGNWKWATDETKILEIMNSRPVFHLNETAFDWLIAKPRNIEMKGLQFQPLTLIECSLEKFILICENCLAQANIGTLFKAATSHKTSAKMRYLLTNDSNYFKTQFAIPEYLEFAWDDSFEIYAMIMEIIDQHDVIRGLLTAQFSISNDKRYINFYLYHLLGLFDEKNSVSHQIEYFGNKLLKYAWYDIEAKMRQVLQVLMAIGTTDPMLVATSLELCRKVINLTSLNTSYTFDRYLNLKRITTQIKNLISGEQE